MVPDDKLAPVNGQREKRDGLWYVYDGSIGDWVFDAPTPPMTMRVNERDALHERDDV
jgi:hypothetical protein